ncbi:hypothetical protein A2U01_0060093, partial [Trifolium medium]|nr:hypothetical protein [Trifolium medium]
MMKRLSSILKLKLPLPGSSGLFQLVSFKWLSIFIPGRNVSDGFSKLCQSSNVKFLSSSNTRLPESMSFTVL